MNDWRWAICVHRDPGGGDCDVERRFPIGSAVTEGGDAVFTVSANPAPASALTVTVTVADDANSDFLAQADEGGKTVTIAGGQTFATLTVPTQNDSTDETDGSVTATLQADTGYTLASPSTATVAVSDNDELPAIIPVDGIAGSSAVTEGGDAVFTIRLGLEGSWTMALQDGGRVTPKLEAGLRHDDGDAETGFGVELGGGLAWGDPRLGLSLDLSGRMLVMHGADDLEDRGFAASLTFDPDPSTERGLSLALRQERGGQATGGLDALFRADPLGARTGSENDTRWSAEVAWGFPALGRRFTGSPHVGLGTATGARDYTLGWRLTPEAGGLDLGFGVTATRRESDEAPPQHGIGVQLNTRW